jgi:Fur family transcriptional regulator, ferric uptake regulator
MKENVKNAVRQILDNYLETNKCRKTPERYAILNAIYDMKGHFSLEQLGENLIKGNFRVSRATLYNAIHLFLELRLVTRHNLMDGTKYEACYENCNHCHQICTVCGKITEITDPEISKVIENMKLKRFRRDSYSLYLYGICSTCQAKITRRKATDIKDNKKKIVKNEYR